MTSRIRIDPKDLELLLQAAAELADLYELNLVPWEKKAPTSGDRTVPDAQEFRYDWVAELQQWREPEEGDPEYPDFKVRVAGTDELLPGATRATAARMNRMRALHKQMTVRVCKMEAARYKRECKMAGQWIEHNRHRFPVGAVRLRWGGGIKCNECGVLAPYEHKRICSRGRFGDYDKPEEKK